MMTSAVRTSQLPRSAVTALVAIASFVFFLRLPLIDDAHIAMCYARTLATSGTWGMYPGCWANAATSPLNVITLGAIGGVVRSYPLAASIVAILSFWTVYLCASSIGRTLFNSAAFGVLAVVAVATNPSVLAAVGLEGPLVAALMVASMCAIVGERWRLCGVVLGLLVLARMDTLLLAVIVLATCALRGAHWRRIAISFLLVTVPWFLFAWIELGSFVPDTFFLKTAQRWGDGVRFLDGPALYWRSFPLASVASILLVPCMPLALFGAPPVRRIACILTAYAVASLAAYALLGPPPCPWYFLQEVIPIAVVGALGIAEGARRFGRVVLALGLVPAAVLAFELSSRPFPLAEQLINVNWGTPARYEEIGRALAKLTNAEDAIETDAEIGTFAYFSERHIVNEFSDQARADSIIDRAEYFGRGWGGWLVAFNFAWRVRRAPVAARWRLTQTAMDDDPTVSTSKTAWDSWTHWERHARFTLMAVPNRVAAPADSGR
jgi:hypothetical protein